MSIKYLNRPPIHHKYIQRVAISSWKHMSFTDVKPYIWKQSRKLKENMSSEEIHITHFKPPNLTKPYCFIGSTEFSRGFTL
jgi:hypothetical protein